MKTDEARQQLLDKFESRTGLHTEIRMKCKWCGKTFWVDAGTVAEKWRNHKMCSCSACYYEALEPVEKK